MRRTQRGGALLITIGVLASLVAILVSAAATQKVGLQAIGNRMQSRRARIIAEAGIQRALASLTNQSQSETTQADDWFTLGDSGNEKFAVGGDSFRIQVVDATSLIDLNTATEEQLAKLPLTQEQIDSLLDWREASLTPRTDGGKDEYYNQLSTPYNAKLQGFTTLNELLLVKGFTAQTIYEPQTDTVSQSQPLPQKPDGTDPTLYDLCTVDAVSGNVDANGQTKPNITTATAQSLMQLGLSQQQAQQLLLARPTTYGAILQRIQDPTLQKRLLETYSVSNAQTLTGKINPNTATQAVLETIPNMQPDVASAIVQRQSTGFTSLGDLLDVPGYSGTVAQQTIDAFTTNSRTFIVRVLGIAGDARVSIEAIVSLTANGVQIQKVTQLPFADMTTRWGWQTDTTAETVLKEAAQ